MRSRLPVTLMALAMASVPAKAISGSPKTVNWPQFRGPHASGISEGYKTPSVWDAKRSQNIKWKTPIPGHSHSSPIIWGNRIFLTTAISGKPNPEEKLGLYGAVNSVSDNTKHTWKVICLNKGDGRVLWERIAHQSVPKIKRHPKSTHANCTPATDGKHVVALFGSEGLYTYDMNGKLLWKKDLGVLDAGFFRSPAAQWGFASSPIIFEGKVIIQADVQGDSFLLVLDVRNGKEIWRVKRDDVPTWSTPTIHVGNDRTQIVVNGYKHIGGYDLRDGKPIWKLKGGGDIPVPTPVVADDLIYITNYHGPKAPIMAIYADAEGEQHFEKMGEHSDGVAWGRAKGGNYMQTPIAYNGFLFTCRDNGVVTIFDAATGETFDMDRLGSGSTAFTSSPVAADGKLYFASEDGDIFVVAADEELGVISINHMGESCMATPAISQGEIFIRTRHKLYCIAE